MHIYLCCSNKKKVITFGTPKENAIWKHFGEKWENSGDQYILFP